MQRLLAMFDDESSDESQHYLPPLQYIELNTRLIQINEKFKRNEIDAEEAYEELIEDDNLFSSQDDETRETVIDWPLENGTRPLIVQAEIIEGDGPLLRFYDGKRNFLTLYKDDDNELIVKVMHSKDTAKIWDDAAVRNIVMSFNQVLNSEVIHYQKLDDEEEVIDAYYHPKSNRFTKASLSKVIDQYQLDHFTYRINHIILNNSRREDDKYSFALKWPTLDGKQQELHVTFSRSDKFFPPKDLPGYSWVMTEKQLLKQFPEYAPYELKPGHCYYSLKITEENPKEEDNVDVLDIWMASDGQYGELHNLDKGKHLSGNDVLNIYRYFDNVFRVKNTFLCDASKIYDEKKDDSVPLRLISSIVTGKTWYENKIPGLKLFECQNFQTAANGRFTQNAAARSKALRELQALPIKKWEKMLSGNQLMTLNDLMVRYCRSQLTQRETRNSSHQFYHQPVNVTLKLLATKIFNHSKSEGYATKDLMSLSNLLCLHKDVDLYDDDSLPDENAHDFWVQSRVRAVMWQGLFWVAKREEQLVDHDRGVSNERLNSRL